jgi:GTPase
MKKTPHILILGRPNVGKSTLINRILGQQKSITHESSGVTRDIISTPVQWNGTDFFIMDSGGIFFKETTDFFQEKIEKSVQNAINKAQKIIFLLDYRQGIQPMDKHISAILQKKAKKVVLAVNKIDDPARLSDVANFYSLGLGKPMAISALHGNGVGGLLDEVIDGLQCNGEDIEELYQELYKISIIGRPNVGKSSLLNVILNEERVIVDHKAGTTRDAIDVYFKEGENKYLFIDTAGISKKIKFADGVDFFSFVRAKTTIRNSDLIIIVLEASNFLVDQDKKIIREAIKHRKNILFFVNKWDLVERSDQHRKELISKALNLFPHLAYYPMIFGSAMEKVGLSKIFKNIPEILASAAKRINTAQLNQFIEEVLRKNPPPAKYGKEVKLYYATQASVSPPVFIFFVNNPALVKDDYKRFVEKRIREYLGGFMGCTIVIEFRGKKNTIKK